VYSYSIPAKLRSSVSFELGSPRLISRACDVETTMRPGALDQRRTCNISRYL
jgi:hypothetical protein